MDLPFAEKLREWGLCPQGALRPWLRRAIEAAVPRRQMQKPNEWEPLS